MEPHFADIFDQSPVAMSVLDLEGRQIAANEAFRRLFRLDARGLPVSELVTDPVDREVTRAALARLRSGELEEVDLEKRYVRPDGTRFRGRLRCRALRDPDGRFAGLIGVIEDVTERCAAPAQVHDATGTVVVPDDVAGGIAATGPGRVLVVEDSPVNQALASHQLGRLGHDHHIVGSGAEALDALAGGAYDVVLMDWNLPDMDGLETTRRIRADEAATGRHRIPIIAVTANAMAGDRERCLDAGMDDFLSKPVTMDELDAALGRWSVGRTDREETTADEPDDDEPTEEGVDPAVFASFVREVGDDAVARSVVGIFLQELEPRRDAVLRAAAAGDGVTLTRTAHVLRSAAMLLGAVRLASVCGRIEHAPPGSDLRADLDDLDRVVPRTAVRLQDLLAELGPPQA